MIQTGSYPCTRKIAVAPLCCEKRGKNSGHGWRDKLTVTDDELIENKVSMTCSDAFFKDRAMWFTHGIL